MAAYAARMQKRRHFHVRGFTLIEMSIVLVVIGLVVGGVLVGRDLIKAAELRSQITQIQEFKSAIVAFRTKYEYLPGDIPDAEAIKFGFFGRSLPITGGNGTLTGFGNVDSAGLSGKNVLLWRDLSTSKLVPYKLDTATGGIVTPLNQAQLSSYLPKARIDDRNFIISQSLNGINYLALIRIASNTATGGTTPTGAVTPNIAFAIDKKWMMAKPEVVALPQLCKRR